MVGEHTTKSKSQSRSRDAMAGMEPRITHMEVAIGDVKDRLGDVESQLEGIEELVGAKI